MGTNRVDLHTHSTYSDGTLTPGELIALAASLNIAAVALTDHNTVNGLEEFFAAAASSPVAPVAGVELSAEFNSKEVHVVGLFLSRGRWDGVAEFVEHSNRVKDLNNRACVEKLGAAGFVVDYEKIKRENPVARINRVHIARELVARGYVSSVSEAFAHLLSPDGPYYREAPKPDVGEAIRAIATWGGVSVLAHLRHDHAFDEIPPLLCASKAAGLDAVETRYSTYTPEDTAFMERMAREYGLLQSGGSDFHGANKPDILLGSGRGALEIPFEFYTQLKSRAVAK